ncbi:MAG TPA: hypothetical protein LFW21_01780 [Rickettsia endosymbiont of Pyrocoelia pectoralis]|nr:hypothetical protein [Rickettsia endosymbiont of Pyrocoelia pectoralis]
MLAIVDEELAGSLKTLHKQQLGEIKLDSLEHNKQIDMLIDDFKNKRFLTKRDKALNLVKLASLENSVRRHKNKVKGISEMLRQTNLRQIAIKQETIFNLMHDLEKEDLTNIFIDKNFETAIAQEIWNITHPDKIETNSIHAKKIAEIIHKHRSNLINRANLAGGHIIPLEGYITKRFHDSKKLRKAGFKAWMEFIEPLLDKQKTGEVDFKEIFNNLATEIHLKDCSEYLSGAFSKNQSNNVANVISANRKLHFKTAENELTYLYEFGNYQASNMVDKALNFITPEKSFLAESIISDLSKLSHSTGILETLGSKPQDMLNSLRNTFISELQEKATVNGRLFSELGALRRSSKFDSRLDLMLGVQAEIPSVERITGIYRAFKCMTSLGSTVISSIPDAMTFVAELQNNAVPTLEAYGNIFKVFTNAKENKEVAKQLGIGIDSLLGNVYTRLSAESSIAGGMSKLTDAFFKLNFMQWWDDSWKSSVGNLLSHNLAANTGKAFGSIDKRLKVLLERYNINESNWHLYKSLVQEIKGNNYLIPDIHTLPDMAIKQYLKGQGKIVNELNITRAKQDITNNLQRYLIDRVDTAIPTAHTHEQSVMQLAGLGIKDGTLIAEIIKCLMQFKTFAYTYVARPLKAITLDQIPVHEQQGFGTFNKDTWKDIAASLQNPTTLKILPQMLLGTTTLGYLSLNAARMLKGQEPLAPNEDGVFMAAVLKGGGLGLYGDFIFGEYDRYRHNLLESLAGPIGGDLIDIGKIYSKALHGDEDTIELTTNLFKRNIPARNLFYLTPALFMVENTLK